MIKNNKPITANEKMNVEHEVFISTREGRVCFEEITHKKVKDKITNKNYLVSYGKLIGDNESVCMIIEQGKEPLFFGQMHGYLHGDIFIKIENKKLFMGIYENSLEQYFDFRRKGEKYLPMQAVLMLNLSTGERDGYVKENLRAITYWDMSSQATKDKTARYLYRSTEKAFNELNEGIFKLKKKEIANRHVERQ